MTAMPKIINFNLMCELSKHKSIMRSVITNISKNTIIGKRKESEQDRKFTRRYARWGFGISVVLALKEILTLMLKAM